MHYTSQNHQLSYKKVDQRVDRSFI